MREPEVMKCTDDIHEANEKRFADGLAALQGCRQTFESRGCILSPPYANRRTSLFMTTNSRFSRPSPGVMGAVLGSILLQSTIAPAEPPPSATVPSYYVGAGVRGGSSDSTAAVIDSKIKLANLGDVTFSTRPAVLLGGYDGEWRLPLTIDYEIADRLSLFGGGGLAYGMDDLDEIDGMVTGGLDFALRPRLIVNLTVNYIWQSSISDDDTEFAVTLNYGF